MTNKSHYTIDKYLNRVKGISLIPHVIKSIKFSQSKI